MDRSPLQKAPLALLGALDLKQLGHNPEELEGAVQPTYETTEHYLVSNQTIVTASANAQIAGTEVSFTVPNGSAFRVKTVNVAITLPATTNKARDGISIRGGIRMPDGTGCVLCSLAFPAAGTLTTGLVNDQMTFTCVFTGEAILLPAGSKIFGQLQCGLDQQGTLAMSALVQSLPT